MFDGCKKNEQLRDMYARNPTQPHQHTVRAHVPQQMFGSMGPASKHLPDVSRYGHETRNPTRYG
jgi:hypothetical protein